MRFVPDMHVVPFAKCVLEQGPPPGFSQEDALRLVMKARYMLACIEIGEPPLRDLVKDVGSMVRQRMIELSEGRDGISGHRSSVDLVFHHQELWGIRDPDLLSKRMIDILTGV